MGIEPGKAEQRTSLGGNSEDTSPLLDLLECQTHDNASTKMQFPRVAPAEDEIENVVSFVVRYFDSCFDLLNFGKKLRVMGIQVATILRRILTASSRR